MHAMKVYARKSDDITLDEVQWIVIGISTVCGCRLLQAITEREKGSAVLSSWRGIVWWHIEFILFGHLLVSL
jgi:hypothetical protein